MTAVGETNVLSRHCHYLWPLQRQKLNLTGFPNKGK